jgi:hypothetical protein
MYFANWIDWKNWAKIVPCEAPPKQYFAPETSQQTLFPLQALACFLVPKLLLEPSQ